MKARIYIRNIKERDLAVFYSREYIEKLFPKFNDSSVSQPSLDIGDIIRIGEQNYKVKNISLILDRDTVPVNDTGLSLIAMDEKQEYDFTVLLDVLEVK